MKSGNRTVSFSIPCAAALLAMFLVIFSRPDMASGQNDQPEAAVQVKDVSIEESHRELLKENKRLRKENSQLLEQVDSLSTRNRLYTTRIRTLNRRIQSLQQELEQARTIAEEVREEMRQKLARISKEKQRITQELSSLKQKKFEQEYYQKWKDTSQELSSAEKKLKKAYATIENYENQNGKLHYNLGTMLFQKGEYKKALKEFLNAKQYLPEDPDIYYNLAILYDYYVKESGKAAAYYQKYLEKSASPESSLRIKERIADNRMRAKVREDE